MPTRTAIPLHKSRMAKFIEAAHEYDDPHKSLVSLLALGTGPRNITIGHVHEDWFFFDAEDDALWMQIPRREPCRKDPDTDDVCGDCRDNGHDHFEPKTPSGKGRQILITDNYANHNEGDRNGKEQYFGLRDMVLQYFGLSDPDAPDGTQHGYRMIGTKGTGISKNTVNNWIRDVAAESGIKAPRRARRIRAEVVDNDEDGDGDGNGEDSESEDEYEDPVKKRGRDEHGNTIPDLFAHDLRASYCTQMMRCEVPPTKAINKTGHSDPDSLKPYVMFAVNEIDAGEEDDFF
jgi:hypothetical protein